jgi:hypothetical protein
MCIYCLEKKKPSIPLIDGKSRLCSREVVKEINITGLFYVKLRLLPKFKYDIDLEITATSPLKYKMILFYIKMSFLIYNSLTCTSVQVA